MDAESQRYTPYTKGYRKVKRPKYNSELIRKIFTTCLCTACLVFALHMTPLPGFAQVEDTVFIQDFPDTLNLRLLWVNKGLNLRVGRQASDSLFYYGPRYQHYMGFGGFLWNIGFNFLVPLPQSLHHDEIKRFDFQGSLFAKSWLLDGIYQRYRGYYISPAGKILSDASNYHNSFLAKKIQASITYLPNGKHLSLRAPFNQGDRQVKTSGSLLLNGGFTYVKLREEDGIIPTELLASGDPLLQSVGLASFTAQIGYACTLIYQDFFVHLFGLTGFGFQQKNYQLDHREKAFALEPVYSGRAALGYDNGKFYTGVYGISDYASFEIQQWQFSEITSQIRLFVGIRLTEPAFIHKRKPKFLERLKNSPNIPLLPILG